MTYAKGTGVSTEKSRSELDKLLTRAGATQRAMGADDTKGMAWVVFRLGDRQVKLTVPLPKLDEERFRLDGRGHRRSPEMQRLAWEQACRERWRAVLLLTKAKLEAVALGISTVEREFLSDILMPDGKTIHEVLAAQLVESYKTGGMPPLLGMGDG